MIIYRTECVFMKNRQSAPLLPEEGSPVNHIQLYTYLIYRISN